MKFIAKSIKKINSFWVEDYTDEEKNFFIEELQFKERVQKFGPEYEKRYLYFDGSGMFGFWSDSEKKKITEAIFKRFKLKTINVQQYVEE